MLYQTVIELAGVGAGSTVLDICSGTGTIGICCAHQGQATNVIGVDICASAIRCAQLNAKVNGVKNATFVASRAELVLEELLQGQTMGQGANSIHAIMYHAPAPTLKHSIIWLAMNKQIKLSTNDVNHTY